jgi:hypothetical protein
MFRYRRTNLREHNVPGLKQIANDKLLFTSFYTLQ